MDLLPMFSKKEALSFGWQTFKANWKFLLLVGIVVGLVSGLPGILANTISNRNVWLGVVLNIAGLILSLLVSLGIIKVSLLVLDEKQAKLADLFSQYRYILHYLAGSILYGLIVFVGFILLIIPGILFSVRMQFWSYFIVDRGMGPIAALKASWKMTKGSAINLLLFDILLGLVNILGALALGVGLLISVPTTWLASAWVYRKLSS